MDQRPPGVRQAHSPRESAVKLLLSFVGLTICLLAGCGGDDVGKAPEPTLTAPPTAVPATAEPGVAVGKVGDGASLRSTDGKLELRSDGKPFLTVSVKAIEKGGPAAPKGWAFQTPVYEITARDGERPVTKLSDAFDLTFRVSPGPATVMYHDGKDWVLVESENDGKGSVTARTDHLTPFVVANPAVGTVTRISATATATSSVPTPLKPTQTALSTASTTPLAGTAEPLPSPSPSATPKPSATTSPVDTNAASNAIKNVVDRFKNRAVKTTGASLYAGKGTVPLPPSIETAIASVASQSELFHGMYNGVNEAIASNASMGGVAATFSLLVEPRTSFPSNSTDAQTQLAAIFPGATGPKYYQSVSNSTTYTYYAPSGTTMYVMGYIVYQGLPMAFLAVGSGIYYGLAIGTSTLQ